MDKRPDDKNGVVEVQIVETPLGGESGTSRSAQSDVGRGLPTAIFPIAELITNGRRSSAAETSAQQTVEPPFVAALALEDRSIAVTPSLSDSWVSNSVDNVAHDGFQSWLMRFLLAVRRLMEWCFGCVSIVVVLAILANIPILQFLSFGYLLETSGRIGRTGKWWSGVMLANAASRIGRFLLGTWLCMWPARLVSDIWYSSHLIEPNSSQTQMLFVVEWILVVGTFCHVLAAGLCGGKLRHFLWPLVAPFSLAVWMTRRLLRIRWIHRGLQATVGQVAPKLLADIVRVEPLAEWFLPAIVWRQLTTGRIWREPQQYFWNYIESLQLKYYFLLGAKGFIGSLIWLIVPTALLIRATLNDDAIAVASGLLGAVLATIVFSVLPVLQSHFAAQQRLSAFIELGQVWRQWRRAPLWHLLSVLLLLILALPLFLLKIEEIPRELLWMLSVVFIVFSWPSRFLLGWAYYRGRQRERPRAWWWALPVASLVMPLAMMFVVIMFFTRYTSWNGSWSMLENHVFLLPAPFWLSFI